jgi:hypothetical protein
MSIIEQKIKEPQSSLKKTELAKELYEELKEIRDTKDKANWLLGRIIYFFDKHNLYNYLFGKATSKKAFWAELDIPLSTADFYQRLYEFWVVEKEFKYDDLKNANTKKLHRAIPYVRDRKKEDLVEVIELAEREKMGLNDFMVSVGAPDSLCEHEVENKNIKVCKKCGKNLK